MLEIQEVDNNPQRYARHFRKPTSIIHNTCALLRNIFFGPEVQVCRRVVNK